MSEEQDGQSSSSSSAAASLLPEVLLLAIFRFLEAKDRACKAAEVCHHWQKLATENNHVWREFCVKTWPALRGILLVDGDDRGNGNDKSKGGNR